MASGVRQSGLALAVIVAALAAALGGEWWFAVHDPASRFLPGPAASGWILYPVPPDTQMQPAVPLRAVFRRLLYLQAVPAEAWLQVRAFGGFRVAVNEADIEFPTDASGAWKQPRALDIAAHLRAGENQLAVTVTNDLGPPILWLTLQGDGWSLASDDQWQVVLAGAPPKPARMALAPVALGAGTLAGEGEGSLASWRARWPMLLLFTILSAGIVLSAAQVWTRPGVLGLAARGVLTIKGALLAAGILWLVLFANDLQSLVFPLGFDKRAHLNYIRYIQEKWALPLADEGWEMAHPPLYYLTSALVLGLCGLRPGDQAGVAVLRLLSGAIGVGQVVLVFACVRHLFPEQPRAQAVGLAVALFLPLHLYLYQYVTNETLAATLGTAAIYLTLRLLSEERAATAGYVGLGLCLGAALLTKVTAVVVIAVVLAVLVGRLLVERKSPWEWGRTVGVTMLACLAVSGWHFARVWYHFGTPLVGSYDPASGFHWWQDPGYATTAQLTRFGRALSHPFFSGFDGFPDGVYSTLWGDGLWGGAGERATRPPWNYDLMAAGYLLALVPSLLILTGGAAALVALVRRPRAEWFLLLGLAFLLGVAMLYHYLKLPYYGHAKAFYGLMGVAVLAALAAWGFDWLARRARVAGVVLGVALGTWAITAYVSFWVRPEAPATQAWLGWQWINQGNAPAAESHFRQALKRNPQDAGARLGLATLFEARGDRAEAERELRTVLRDHPANVRAHVLLALACQRSGRTSEAVDLLRQAIALAPDDPQGHAALGYVLLQQNQVNAAVQAYRQAVGLAPGNWQFRHDLGTALAKEGQPEEAAEQQGLAEGMRQSSGIRSQRAAGSGQRSAENKDRSNSSR
jgi:Tfp pilus assembly protein PilF